MIQLSPIISSLTKSFIFVTKDNRIHLWDTDSRREKHSYVEKNHLSHNYVCCCWKQVKQDSLGFFAVGCSDGVVIIWDLARGVVVKTIGVSNESPVPTDLVFSIDGTSIFVSSSQNHIIQYRLVDGEQINSYKAGKRGILKLAMNSKVDVLAVARYSIY